MRTLALVIILACAACTKKPAPKQPAPPAPDAETAPAPGAEPAPAPAPPVKSVKPGDPCDGGEKPKP